MGKVLLFVEHTEGHLRSSALSGVSFARAAAGPHEGFALLLIGPGARAAAADAGKYAPEVIVVEDAGLSHYLAETYAEVVAKIAKEQGATLVAGTATAVGKDLLPRVAGLLGAGMASDVVAVSGPRTFTRPMQAGNLLAKIEVTTPIVVASVRQSAFAPATAAGGSATVHEMAAGGLDARGASFVALHAAKSDRPELTDAKRIVSGGRGMKEGKNFKVLEELADLLGAAMGASRAATDAGMVPSDLQVGQTGKVVAPELYIAVAISGAIQHLAGMKASKVIVAINKDPEAPIFQVADYGLVTTWELAIPQLLAEVKKLQAAQR